MAAALPSPTGARHIGAELDHMQPDLLEEQLSAAVELAGPVDILVNNGHAAEGADWTNITPEQFTRQLANATGYFVLSRLVRHHAVERKAKASVILIGSMYGLVGSYPDAYEGVCAASPVAYHVLKEGLST